MGGNAASHIELFDWRKQSAYEIPDAHGEEQIKAKASE
jgi:hypothetical protein